MAGLFTILLNEMPFVRTWTAGSDVPTPSWQVAQFVLTIGCTLPLSVVAFAAGTMITSALSFPLPLTALIKVAPAPAPACTTPFVSTVAELVVEDQTMLGGGERSSESLASNTESMKRIESLTRICDESIVVGCSLTRAAA